MQMAVFSLRTTKPFATALCSEEPFLSIDHYTTEMENCKC